MSVWFFFHLKMYLPHFSQGIIVKDESEFRVVLAEVK